MLCHGHRPPEDSSLSSEDSRGPGGFEGVSERGWFVPSRTLHHRFVMAGCQMEGRMGGIGQVPRRQLWAHHKRRG